MNLTGTTARVELTATADLTSVNTTGSATIGTPNKSIPYNDDPTVAYSLRFQMAAGVPLVFNSYNGVIAGTEPGVAQVETLTATGTVSVSGNAKITITGANLEGSPIDVIFPVTSGDVNAAWAAKARAAISAVPQLVGKYYTGGSGQFVVLTQVTNDGNDPTLLMTVTNVTSAGITPTSSANTAVGVMATKATRINGAPWDQTDYQGQPLPPGMSKIYSVLIQSESTTSQLSITNSVAGDLRAYACPITSLEVNPDGQLLSWFDETEFLSPGDDVIFTLDIHAGE